MLSEDKGVKEELEILLNETKFRISSYLSEISSFNEEKDWYIGGTKVPIDSEFDLAEILSDKCYELYNCTPVILNDSFNRNLISGCRGMQQYR